ncbi:MAG: response regulator [Deltaproteobacteria bacterium]|nr:response regulator [Deltaproteobacteria bacterium]
MDLFNKLKNMRILLIDDDEWIRDSMSLFFESEGCNLKALETAKEGLKTRKNKNYDIIIADYRLPDMDGLEFFKRIQKSHPNAFKILITAYGSKELLSKARKMGIHDFIEKPFTSETIENSLSRLIKGCNRKANDLDF